MQVTVKIDRPMGSRHPQHPNIFYTVNYGYVQGVFAPDGEEQDAYVLGVPSPVHSFTGRLAARIHRFDDVEEKWVVTPANCCFTKEQIAAAVHFQEQFFQTEIIMLSEEDVP